MHIKISKGLFLHSIQMHTIQVKKDHIVYAGVMYPRLIYSWSRIYISGTTVFKKSFSMADLCLVEVFQPLIFLYLPNENCSQGNSLSCLY